MSLPDGEWVPLLHQPTRYHRGTIQYIHIPKQTWISPGDSVIIPLKAVPDSIEADCTHWVHRGRRWVTTALTGSNRVPAAFRVTNVSQYGVSLLPRTIIGAVSARGERPLDTQMIRVNSNRYRAWENEVYEGSFPRSFRDKLRDDQRQEIARSYPPPSPREAPSQLLTQSGLRPLHASFIASDSKAKEGGRKGIADESQDQEGRRSMDLQVEESSYDCEVLSDGSSEDDGMLLGNSLPHPQIFHLKSVPNVDQSQCDPELQIREGIDMSPEEMENQLALIPEITQCSEPVRIEDLDYGEADQSDEEREKMRVVLAKYQQYFIQSGNGLPPAARGAVCDIDVKGAKPIAQRARRVRPEHLKQLFELLKGLLDYGLITFSNFPWASPIVIVLKKGGSNIRLCIDYRAINDLQELLLSPMPTLDSMLANFDATQWFLSLDNASGFWVVRATKRARRVSAFICPLGHFEWTRMAQGLKNAPMIYQRMISNALFGFVDLPPGVNEMDKEGEPRDMFKINYRYPVEEMPPVANRTSFADDISDGAETWDGIVELTDRILSRLTHFNISISASKSKFGKRRIEFLGHWIAQDGLSARPKGLAQLVNLPFPASLQGIQSFLGSLNFYSRFIENYSIKASSLYELSREEIEGGEVSDAAKLSFEELKRDFAALPTLKHSVANQDVHILLYTTKWAISATVCQEFEGALHPIRFCGRVLKGGEPRYEGWAKEVLALLRVLKTCFFEVRSRMLVVYTRFALLNWLLKDKQAKSENLHWAAMLAPWSIKVVQVQELDGRWNLPIMLTRTLSPPDSTTLESFELFEPNKAKDGLRPRQVRMPTITELNGAYLAAFDGSIKTSERFGAWGAIIWLLPEWKVVWASSGALENATVNLAEYQGAISALNAALRLGIQSLHVFGDSKLVIHQALDWMQCKQSHLQGKLRELRELEKKLIRVDYHHVLRK
ncbi:hypothetical protein Ae201684_000780 [Aphanomyces euteiches]|uniref:Uncharacterized protein n=1 Tax=Aphanomyces euteiches TaxID=100861 RepID=A0A6G0XUX7_9STRA|nr:hypothetical protein Ae201684_000780 [Aphanomyces euteiches]